MMLLNRETIIFPSKDRAHMVIALVVSGAAGWTEVLFLAPLDKPKTWGSWTYNAVRHIDGACMESGMLLGDEMLAVFLREGSEAVFKILEGHYKQVAWDGIPFNIDAKMKKPGPLPQEVPDGRQ